jgi:hypothetical protein
MIRAHLTLFCIFILPIPGSLFAEQTPQPTAEAIMARVAAHQDQAEADRRHYVYVQHAKVTSRKGNTPMCEEITDYRITPGTDNSHAELVKVDGRVLIDHKYVQYSSLLPSDDDDKAKDDGKSKGNDKPVKNDGSKALQNDPAKKDSSPPPDPPGGDGIDRNIVEHMRDNLLSTKSKDGIDARLFPLTSKAQADYTFQLAGRQKLNGRDVFHVIFRPKDKKDFGWKGDAYIDAADYQPVMVNTGMSRKVPFAVRTFLGTDVPGLGFNVAYAPQPDGVWFPVSFGTEFKLDALFFFRREIIMSAENRDFQKTHGDAHILDGATPVESDKPER